MSLRTDHQSATPVLTGLRVGVVLALVVIALVAALCGAARAVPLVSPDLPWAAASAQFDVVVTDDPHPAVSPRGRSGADAWIANVTILAWSTSSDGVHPVDLPSRLRVTTDIHAVLPGTRLVLRGRVVPGDPWRRTAATVIGADVRVVAPSTAR